MGFSIFLIPLLLVTVASISVDKSSMMTKIFQNPQAFVATFHDANPDQINAVIEMIDGLIATATEEKELAESEFDKAEAASIAADTAEKEALEAEWEAVGHWNNSKQAVLDQELIVKSKKDAEELLQESKSAASTLHEEAKLDFDMGTEVINLEQAKLEEIRAVLKEMAEKATDIQTRRRLLALVKIDPDKIDEVDAIILDLIEKGEDEREALTTALKEAKDALDSQSSQFDAAVQEHLAAKVELDTLNGEKAAAHSVAEEKTKLYEEAVEVKKQKNADLVEKTTVRDETVPRVDRENGTLNDVKRMLQDLLD